MEKDFITFHATDGKAYKLTLTRETVANMQRRGFNHEKIDEQPNVMIPMLVTSAFHEENRKLRNEEIMAMYATVANKVDFLRVLLELYLNTVNTLFEDAEEDEGKNATWE